MPEFAADVVAPILGRLGFSKKLLKKVGIDLAEYWQENGEFAGKLRGRVRQALRTALDAGENIALISHGTGCIVTYDVLWELSHDPEYAG